ncbi:site-2 protease family protein, partial [Staphylococcus epidermidis]|uniref:site-2 protease family protein n=1 Tax=Staphylococcus epidermidis TaxID=1282 RepID=UPI0037D9DCD1
MMVFGVVVSVEEYGQMFFGKGGGIMCGEFGIGMGGKIFSFGKDERLYRIRVLGVGGYVRMGGDGVEERGVEGGMKVKIKLNKQEEMRDIIVDEQDKFEEIE